MMGVVGMMQKSKNMERSKAESIKRVWEPDVTICLQSFLAGTGSA